MSLAEEVEAIRKRVAFCVEAAPVAVVLEGPEAFRAADLALPTDLFLRDAQARQSLFLDARGRPFADVLVARDDERYLLRVDGPDRAQTLAYLEAHAGEGLRAHALDVTSVSLHGPWAWELLGAAFGEGLSAIPYLNLFRVGDDLAVRAGRTGEYGYELLVAPARADALVARISECGARFGLARASREAVAHCGYESWFYDPARAPDGDVTAIELQLQWRLSPTKRYPGRDAIDARRREGVRARLVCVVTDDPVAAGDPVLLGGEEVGRITRSERSLTRGDAISHALLDVRVAHGGIRAIRVLHEGDEVPARTAAPPLVSNWSLAVDPRRHSYACADEVKLPPLARGGLGAAGAR